MEVNSQAMVIEGDCLPEQICKKCERALEMSFALREQVELADARLRQMYEDGQTFLSTIASKQPIENESANDWGEASDKNSSGVTAVYDEDTRDQAESIDWKIETEDPHAADTPEMDFIIELNEDEEAEDIIKAINGKLGALETPWNDVADHKKREINDFFEGEKSTWKGEVDRKMGRLRFLHKKQYFLDGKYKKKKKKDVLKTEEDLWNDNDVQRTRIKRFVRDPLDPSLMRCSICEMEVGQVNQARHYNIFHKSYLCEICGRSFANKNDLTDHLEVHNYNNGNFTGHICDICGKSYLTAKKLRDHQRYHFDLPYTCDVCSKTFIKKLKIQRHMVTHTKAMPFKCSFCQRRFNQKWNLSQHERIHTGVLPYECNLCGLKFRHNVTMKQHRKRHFEASIVSNSEAESAK